MRTRLHRNQLGMSSLLVTMLMMVITSLIVLAFAQIARREQRTALDNQLSSQAFYAAESGVNDARQVIEAGDDLSEYNVCNNPLTASPNADLSVAKDRSVRYTCITIDSAPQTLIGTGKVEEPTILRIKSSLTSAPYFPAGITISWDRPLNNDYNAADCPNSASADMFTAADPGAWRCPFSVLRYELLRIPPGGTYTPTSLETNTQTAFVIPRGGGGAVGYNNSHGNKILATTCTNNRCSITINGLTSREYYLNLRYLYGTESRVTVSRPDTGRFVDSQVHIDSTGKAQDVLRRIRVAMNVSGDESGIGTAILAGDGPCKLQFIGADASGVPTYRDACADDGRSVVVSGD